MKKFLILTILITCVFSCNKMTGTDVDNPFTDPNGQCDGYNNGNGRCMPTPVVQLQMGVICTKINQCLNTLDNDSHANCTTLLQNQNGLGVYVSTTANNYTQLNNLYNQKQLLTNSLHWNSCLEAISELDCQSNTFTNAYNVNDPLNFSKIHNILLSDASCSEVYKMKSTTSGTTSLQQ